MQQLTIRTFGETDVRVDGQSVKWRSDSARVLFFYLLSHPNGRTRDQIIETLWHTDPDFAVSGRFRVVVYRLRAALRMRGAVLEDHSHYRLEPEIVALSDAQRFTQVIRQAEHSIDPDAKRGLYELALKDYTGDYLPDETTDWVVNIRAQHRTTAAHALLELSVLQRERGECEASMDTLGRALALDPLIGEDHHQQLMLCLSTVKGKYAAVEHYRRYVSHLRADLGDTPMIETTALAGRIKNSVAPCTCPNAGPSSGADSLPASDTDCHRVPALEGAMLVQGRAVAEAALLQTNSAPLVTRV